MDEGGGSGQAIGTLLFLYHVCKPHFITICPALWASSPTVECRWRANDKETTTSINQNGYRSSITYIISILYEMKPKEKYHSTANKFETSAEMPSESLGSLIEVV